MSVSLYRRRGLTLIEVLVVLFVVLLLFALTMPWLHQTTGDARGGYCKNNLKQIGLALHNYHDVLRMFPPGYIADHSEQPTDTGGPNGSRWAWSVYILPYMDQGGLYNSMNVENGSVPVPLADSAFDKTLPIFLCPSDPSDEEGPGPAGTTIVGYTDRFGKYYQRSSYVACNGAAKRVSVAFTNQTDNSIRGIFGHSTNTRIRDIPDGTSNTIFVGERDMTKDFGAIWMRAAPGIPYQAQAVLGVTGVPLHQADLRKSPPRIGSFGHGFSGMHEGGAHCVLADGSTRFIRENIDPTILKNLGARNDGNIIPDF